jgi:hypothetical protein
MKVAPATIACLLVACAVAACGDGAHAGGTATSALAPSPANDLPASPQTKVDSDEDSDISLATRYDDKHHRAVLEAGRAASPAAAAAVTAVLKRYYAAAEAGNGAAACAMILKSLARAVPEDYGEPPGPPYMRSKTCQGAMTLLFKHYHPQLALELPRLRVARIRASGSQATAFLTFAAMPERMILLRQESGNGWKLAALLDSELP